MKALHTLASPAAAVSPPGTPELHALSTAPLPSRCQQPKLKENSLAERDMR